MQNCFLLKNNNCLAIYRTCNSIITKRNGTASVLGLNINSYFVRVSYSLMYHFVKNNNSPRDGGKHICFIILRNISSLQDHRVITTLKTSCHVFIEVSNGHTMYILSFHLFYCISMLRQSLSITSILYWSNWFCTVLELVQILSLFITALHQSQ